MRCFWDSAGLLLECEHEDTCIVKEGRCYCPVCNKECNCIKCHIKNSGDNISYTDDNNLYCANIKIEGGDKK